MARCGCQGSQCNCVIAQGENVTVSGSGTPADPYIVSAEAGGGTVTVTDTPSINFGISGDGSVGTPWNVTGSVKRSAAVGNAITENADGLMVSCAAINACVTPGGAPSVGAGISGTGSPADPLKINGLTAWPYTCAETNGRLVYFGTDGRLLVDPPATCANFQVALGTPILFSGFCGTIPTTGVRTRFSTQTNRLVINNPDLCKPMLVDLRGSAVIFLDGDGNGGTGGTPTEGNWLNQIVCGIIFNGATGPGWQQVGISGHGLLNYRIDAFQVSIPPGGALTVGSWFDGQADNACHVDGASVQHPNIIAFGRTCG